MSLRVVIPLFDGITALDAIGPYEVLSRLPGAEVHFAAPEPGPQWTDRREVALVASHALADVDAADVLLVPGGFGTRPLLTDQTWLDWVRRVHETTQWTTSVCTGSLLLGAAGCWRDWKPRPTGRSSRRCGASAPRRPRAGS